MTQPLLSIDNLSIAFSKQGETRTVVTDLSLQIQRGETLALVGESGSGKSVSALSILRLLPSPPASYPQGDILFHGSSLLHADEHTLRGIRGNKIAMIFQEPMVSLNPLHTLEKQLYEVLSLHRGMRKEAARGEILDCLERTGIRNAAKRLNDFPHQLSGGMRQRVMIAMALINHPKLLIADEPTTALDVTIQAQILTLLNTLKEETGTAVLMITHDLGVVAEVAQQVAVMYAGQVVEQGSVEAIFADPQHPYTIGLMGSIPSLGARKGQLSTIPGSVPLPESMPKGCRFATRCPFAQSRCHDEKPPLNTLGAGHQVACFRVPLEHHIALGETA